MKYGEPGTLLRRSLRAMRAATLSEQSLPQYHQDSSAVLRAARYTALYTFAIVAGLVYGALFAIFPPQLLVSLAIPIALLALLVIWALPDIGRAPTRLLSKLMFAFLLSVVLWPNYLAIQLPGLPWISLRRIIAFPSVIVLLCCLSVSQELRETLRRTLSSAKPIHVMIVIFTTIQLVTLFFSGSIVGGMNRELNYWIGVTAFYYISVVVLNEKGRVEAFVNVILASTVLILIITVLEHFNGRVLWADHIPSFLQIEDRDLLESYLSAQKRDGGYRTAGTFSNALALGEFFAIVTPFVIHRAMSSSGLFKQVFWAVFDLSILVGILCTQSRLGILGWILAHFIYGFIWSYRRWSRIRTDLMAPAISILYPTFAAFIFVGMFTIPAIRNRTIGGGSTGMSDEARRTQFKMMWPKILENPFGYGAGSSGGVVGYRAPNGMITIDSYIITMLVDYGILGFACFFGMFAYAAYRMSLVSWRSRSAQCDLAMPLTALMVIVIQIRAVLAQTDSLPLLYMLLGVATVIMAHDQRRKQV